MSDATPEIETAEAAPVVEETAAPAPEPEGAEDSGDAAYDAIWQKLVEGEEGEAPAPDGEKEQDEGAEGEAGEAKAEEETEAAPAPEAPKDLPATLREHWGTLTPEARNAIEATHREMSNRMAEQGRVVKQVKPIYDALSEAVQRQPEVANLSPEQLARDSVTMQQVKMQLTRDPVGTIMTMAQQLGKVDDLRRALGGEGGEGRPDQSTAREHALVHQIRGLEQRLAQMQDPRWVTQIVQQESMKTTAQTAIAAIAAETKDWPEVEKYIPDFVPVAKATLPQGASPGDVLKAAYDMAKHAIPELRAKMEAAAPAPAEPDPKQTEAQLRAKSVNVRSSGTGKPKAMTEDEAMAAVWDKHTS